MFPPLTPVAPAKLHFPDRPSWRCDPSLHAGEPPLYPCREERERLLSEHADDHATLKDRMAVMFERALEDQPDAVRAALWDQLVGWVEPEQEPCTPS